MFFNDIKDTLKRKYKEEEELEKFKNFLENKKFEESKVVIKDGRRGPSIEIDRRIILKIVDDLIKTNDRIVEAYMRCCYETKLKEKFEKEKEKNNEQSTNTK